LRFHAVYWPAFLSALECTPETLSAESLEKACGAMQIVAHGWWLSEGEKMSKSLGNTLDPKDLVEKYGADYLRYYFLREPSFGGDGNFTREGFALRINGELINNIGNLCQRTFALTHKNCNSMVPDAQVAHPLTETPLLDQVTPLVDEFRLNQAIEVILNYASKANEYVQETKPWALFKSGEEQKGRESLYVLLHAIYMIKEALYPILPEFHERISGVFDNQTFRTGLQLNPLAKVFEQVEV
jgi:methionyl-tRNA synthetase